jgi:hypothetical protein
VQVNEVTWKLADNRESTNTPASHGKWGGFRMPVARAWLIGLGNGLWIARCRDEGTNPLPLHEAKKIGMAMAKGERIRPINQPLKRLNLLQAFFEDEQARVAGGAPSHDYVQR